MDKINRSTWIALGSVTVVSLSLMGLVFANGEAAAPPSAGKVRLGTYDSRAIAVAYAHSRFCTEPKTLMEDLKKAEAAGDTKKLEELKKRGPKLQDHLHRQGFGREPVDDILVHIKDSFPDVCKEAGVDAIVSGVVHAIPAVKTVDVTNRLVKRFEPSENTLKMVEEM